MKKLLICGASGFIGRNLAEYFAASGQYEVHGTYFNSAPLEMEGVKLTQANLTNQADVDRVISGKDIVIQAAATTSGAKEIINKPYYHVTDNAVMNSLIYRSAFENKIEHLIFYSCTVMYQSSETPLKENDFNAAEELHKNYFGAGWTKVYLEKMADFFSRISDTKFTVFRHSNIYGPYDKYDLERSHVFGATITKVMTAKEGSSISVWGQGKAKRDLLHVEDLMKATDLALESQKESYQLFNIGLGKAVSVADLVQKIIDASGKNVSIEFDINQPDIETTLCLDTSLAKEKIAWQPQISLEDGIAKTIAWYQDNPPVV
nr:NAD-dependent epimerase/dehydratase family protein [uncultured Desulfobacter sp.]